MACHLFKCETSCHHLSDPSFIPAEGLESRMASGTLTEAPRLWDFIIWLTRDRTGLSTNKENGPFTPFYR